VTPPKTLSLWTGGIVGVVQIIDVVRRSDSRWFSGPYGFVLHGGRPLPFVACRGALGLFDVSDGIAMLLRGAVAAMPLAVAAADILRRDRDA
jgi:hypothetical protein